MAFTPKDWKNATTHEGGGDTSTPISEAALEDLETRVTDYVATAAHGVNVWESEDDPGSVTDWGAIINALIAAGNRFLFLGNHDFPYTTPIVAVQGTDKLARLIGSGGRLSGSTQPATRLIYKSTGTAIAFDASGSLGIHIENVCFAYDSASYTGNLTKFAAGRLENCRFTSLSPAAKEANCLVSLNGADGVSFESCSFGGAQSLIRGHEAEDWTSRFVSFRDCYCASFEDAAIMNPGNPWEIDGLKCEFNGAGTAAKGITADLGNEADPHHGNFARFTLVNSEFFNVDNETNTQQEIVQPYFSPWGFTARNVTGGEATTLPVWQFESTGSVAIEHCGFGVCLVSPIDVGEVADPTPGVGDEAQKDRIYINQVSAAIQAYQDPDLVVTNWGFGHVSVNIQGISHNSDNLAHGPGVSTVAGPERFLGNEDEGDAGVAYHSGYSPPTNFVSTYKFIRDRGGLIFLNTANGAAPAGLALDVTFPHPVYASYRGDWRGQWPIIQVFPMAIAEYTEGNAYTDVDVAFDAEPYAWSDAPHWPGDLTTPVTRFVIGFVNEVASSKKFALGYRVIFL